MYDIQTFEECEAWLKPMGFDRFFDEMAKIGLYGPDDRAHCERTLQEGTADMDTVMGVTKSMALFALVEEWDLPFAHELKRGPELVVID